MVLKQDGSVWATGFNAYGQLGDGSTIDSTNYIQVMSSGARGGVKTIVAGSRHSMVLKQDSSVWATGHNELGQLGDGSIINKHIFKQVIASGVQVVAAGHFHSMVAKEDGSIWATGSNEYDQFGDPSISSKKFFVRLTPFNNGSKSNKQLRYSG